MLSGAALSADPIAAADTAKARWTATRPPTVVASEAGGDARKCRVGAANDVSRVRPDAQ